MAVTLLILTTVYVLLKCDEKTLATTQQETKVLIQTNKLVIVI